MSTQKVMVKERHDNLRQSTSFQIETIDPRTMTWVCLKPALVQKDGKYIQYHTDFKPFTQHFSRDYSRPVRFAFHDESIANALAKALSKVWDMPLRVVRVQRIRIQKVVSKIILPVNGV